LYSQRKKTDVGANGGRYQVKRGKNIKLSRAQVEKGLTGRRARSTLKGS